MSAYEKAARAAQLQEAISYHALSIWPTPVQPVSDEQKAASSRTVNVSISVDWKGYHVTQPTIAEMQLLQKALERVLKSWELRESIANGVRAAMHERLDGLCEAARSEAASILGELQSQETTP
jgi:hypothetical protein